MTGGRESLSDESGGGAAGVPPLAPLPPVAARDPAVSILHGETRRDDYFWMREKDSSRVLNHLRAENAYTDEVMRPTDALQQDLYREMVVRIKETDRSAPWPFAGWWWYTRTAEGLQYPIYARRRGNLEAPEEIVLDLNALAEGRDYVGLGAWTLSADGQTLAYSIDETGFREHTLRIKNLVTGELAPEAIERVDSVAWAGDGRTLFYVTEDEETKRSNRLWRLVLGSGSPAQMLHEETDERFSLSIERARSLEWLFLRSDSLTASEVRVLPAATPDAPFRLVAAREPDHEYDVEHRGDRFYIRSNAGGRRNFRVLTTPVATPGPEHWQELVAVRDEVMIEGVDLFAGHCVLLEREAGLPHIGVLDLVTGATNRITFAEDSWWAGPSRNHEFAATAYRYEYQSLTTPASVFEYDFAARTSRLLKREEVGGGYDPSIYEVHRLSARAADGTPVPISLVRRKGLPLDGTTPLVLAGYGAYGISSEDRFSSTRVSLLNRGIAVAIAHIRGGGELGKAWHDGGRMSRKRNTFSDFIAAAEQLIAEGWTDSDRLLITGGSAGGLLVGAVVNQRPELFRGVLALVPFVDVINTMLDESLPLTTAEFEEWGNPKVLDQYRDIRAYSPYDNVVAQAYPAMLIKASYNDSQVPYWEAAKWTAKLRALKSDHNRILLKMDLDPAGHMGKSGRYDRLHEIAFEYAWMLTELGISR